MSSKVIALAVALLAVSSLAQAGACRDRVNSLPRIPTHCAGLDTSVTLEGNPFVYTNPDAGCDLGLSMPGLPSFGNPLGDLNIDSCKILKSVTGDLVKEINAGFRDAVDDSLGRLADEANDVNINPNDYIDQQTRNNRR